MLTYIYTLYIYIYIYIYMLSSMHDILLSSIYTLQLIGLNIIVSMLVELQKFGV